MGNKAYYNASGIAQSGYGLANAGSFQNLQNFVYWSGTVYAPNPGYVWTFGANGGGQDADVKYNDFYAMAVRAGDVAAVPEPEEWAMMFAGVGLVAVAVRRLRG